MIAKVAPSGVAGLWGISGVGEVSDTCWTRGRTALTSANASSLPHSKRFVRASSGCPTCSAIPSSESAAVAMSKHELLSESSCLHGRALRLITYKMLSRAKRQNYSCRTGVIREAYKTISVQVMRKRDFFILSTNTAVTRTSMFVKHASGSGGGAVQRPL